MKNVVIIDRKRLREAIRPKSMLELWPQAYQTVQVIRCTPGMTVRQLSTYFGWKENAKVRMLQRLVNEGYLTSKLVPVIGRNGRKSRTRAYWAHKEPAQKRTQLA